MIFRSQKFMNLMRELPCSNCGSEDGTVCAAHRNEGKGMGLKVSDALVIPLCYNCHMEFDQGKEMSRDGKRMLWDSLYIKTMSELIESKRLKF